MSNPFITNMRKTLDEKKSTGLSSIAPAANDAAAPVESAVASEPSIVPEPPVSGEKKCVLMCIPAQPKSGKDICLPVYEDRTKKVLRMGIRLSAAPDNVPCAYYHNKNRLVMGVTMMHALSEAGEVLNVPYNVKDKTKQDELNMARKAVRDAFEAHHLDEDLTHVRLLTYAGLYDGASKLSINYQTYERLINELLGAPAAAPAPRKKRASSEVNAAEKSAVADEEDEDDAFIAGPKKRRIDNDGTIDADLLEAANDLNFSEEEEEESAAVPAISGDELTTPTVIAPVKKQAVVPQTTPKVKAQTMNVEFVQAKLFSILQNCNQNDLSLWDALQSESLDSYFIFKLSHEMAHDKRKLNRNFLMAALFSKMRQAASMSEEEMWELTNRMIGL